MYAKKDILIKPTKEFDKNDMNKISDCDNQKFCMDYQNIFCWILLLT